MDNEGSLSLMVAVSCNANWSRRGDKGRGDHERAGKGGRGGSGHSASGEGGGRRVIWKTYGSCKTVREIVSLWPMRRECKTTAL